MSVKPDWWIEEQAKAHNMISPFIPSLASTKWDESREWEVKPIISYGLASAAYDARLADEFAFYVNRTIPLDPMNVGKADCCFRTTDSFLLGPGQFVLATTMETFIIPRNIVAMVAEKSTYKRCGISIGNTRLEPEWCGQITLEIKNDNPSRSVILRAGEGIVAIEFHSLMAQERENVSLSKGPNISYADRKGKYQGQKGVTLPKGIDEGFDWSSRA